MSVFTVSPRSLLSRRTHVVLRYDRAHVSCACRNPPWGWPCGGERAAHDLSSVYDVVCLQHCPFLSYVVHLLTCVIGRQYSAPFGLLLRRRRGQRWRPASAEQACRSPGPMRRGGHWVRVDGGVCGGRHHRQEEEGERGREATRSALQESKASAVERRLRRGKFLPRVVPRQ